MDEAAILRMIQIGTVSAVDEGKHKVMVHHPATGLTSPWLSVLQHYDADIHVEPDNSHDHSGEVSGIPDHSHDRTYLEYWMPKVGETVVCVYIGVQDGDGFVLGRVG